MPGDLNPLLRLLKHKVKDLNHLHLLNLDFSQITRDDINQTSFCNNLIDYEKNWIKFYSTPLSPALVEAILQTIPLRRKNPAVALQLQAVGLTAESLPFIIKLILLNLPSLTYLDLSQNSALAKVDLEPLKAALKKNTYLETINVSGSVIDAEVIAFGILRPGLTSLNAEVAEGKITTSAKQAVQKGFFSPSKGLKPPQLEQEGIRKKSMCCIL